MLHSNFAGSFASLNDATPIECLSVRRSVRFAFARVTLVHSVWHSLVIRCITKRAVVEPYSLQNLFFGSPKITGFSFEFHFTGYIFVDLQKYPIRDSFYFYIHWLNIAIVVY